MAIPILASLVMWATANAAPSAPAVKLALWYTEPAADWQTQAMPIGNGRIGAMIFGDPQHERLQVNEDSLWEGDENATGEYQSLGDIKIELSHGAASGYRRELDLSRAIQSVQYNADGIAYRRSYFASHPAEAMIFQFTADKPGAYSGLITFADAHGNPSTAEGNRITAGGALKNGLQFESQLIVIHQGGTLSAGGDGIRLDHADGFVIFFNARTNYINQRSRHWRSDPPHARLTAGLEAAAKMPLDQLLAEHVADYQKLFSRVAIDLARRRRGQSRCRPTSGSSPMRSRVIRRWRHCSFSLEDIC